MADYERFGSSDEKSSSVMPEVSENEVAEINDVQIKTEKAGETGLTIYDTETKENLEYIEDPSKVIPRTIFESLQVLVQTIVESFVFRVLTVLLILLDFTLVVIDLSNYACDSNSGLEIVSHIIISYFLLEVGARLLYLQRRFFYSIIDVIDGFVVLSSFVVDMVFVAISTGDPCTSTSGEDYAKLIVIGRVFRIIRIVRIVYLMVQQRRHVATATRHVVSQNKRRYQRDWFDLDLCYITERVIAMSFPSSGIMALYRNPIHEVARFFNTKHPEHYRIYNLCSERDHQDTSLFHNRVERIFIDDHNVPTVRDMVWFCNNAREFMEADKRNVISLHCKGGKGRTGAMICVWLVHCGIFEDAKESLDYFGDRRTDLSVGTKFQGVETPSQSRFVGYYEKVKKQYNDELPPRKELKITSFKIESIAGNKMKGIMRKPVFRVSDQVGHKVGCIATEDGKRLEISDLEGVGNGDGTDLSLELRADGLLIFEARVGEEVNCERSHDKEKDSIEIKLKNCPVLADDIKVRFLSTNKNFPKIYDHCAFYFWFHTSFIEENWLYLSREEIDNPHKKAGRKVFRETFAIEVNFEEPEH